MLHETLYAGGLLYALGVVAGHNADGTYPPDLFHKTPPGKTFADMLMQWQGRNFIVEFKRDESGLRSEVEKSNRTRLMIGLVASGYVSFSLISEQCHFIAYGNGKEHANALLFKKYLRFDNAKEPTTELQPFIGLLRDPDTAFGIKDGKVFKAYLDLVIKNAGDKPAAGMLINITPTHPPCCIGFSSYSSLHRQLYATTVEVKPGGKRNGN